MCTRGRGRGMFIRRLETWLYWPRVSVNGNIEEGTVYGECRAVENVLFLLREKCRFSQIYPRRIEVDNAM